LKDFPQFLLSVIDCEMREEGHDIPRSGFNVHGVPINFLLVSTSNGYSASLVLKVGEMEEVGKEVDVVEMVEVQVDW